MKDEQVRKLLAAFDRQQLIIKEQSEIIDRLFEIVALHVSASEAVEIGKEIKRVVDIKEGIYQ